MSKVIFEIKRGAENGTSHSKSSQIKSNRLNILGHLRSPSRFVHAKGASASLRPCLARNLILPRSKEIEYSIDIFYFLLGVVF